MEETRGVKPFSMQEAHFGREAAHKAYSSYCTRLSDENLITLCKVATNALEKVHAGVDFGKAVTHALRNEGITDRSEEGKVRQQLYLRAVSAMFTARKPKEPSQATAAEAKKVKTRTPKEEKRAQLSLKF